MEQTSSNTALLVMDMQMGILPRLPNAGALKEKVGAAIAFARNNKIPVKFITVGFRAGFPDVSPHNKSFGSARTTYAEVDMAHFMTVDPALAPLPEEPVIVKRRVSAFTGSDLEVLLRSQGIAHLVLAGVSTGGVMLSTVREAADKDYRITVLADCCADPDEEVHQLLLKKIFPRQAEVIFLAQWITS